MTLYNTLTKQKESFLPAERNAAAVYSCGPTVYGAAHLGNMRTYLFTDTLRRALRFAGFDLNHVMNITDVGHLVSDGDDGEDKMSVGARKLGKTPAEIAAHYTELFLGDLDKLGIERPETLCKATDHIPEMLTFVRGLMDKGFGYEINDGIYFDISKFPAYGKLSKIDLEGQQAGARVEENKEKHTPFDFALWKKAAPEHLQQWDSAPVAEWRGYPGWHIECSAMSRRYLGDMFDIHTGGVDHIPVHHENEIAQTEALLGHPSVRFWVHGEFLMIDNGKMSKSLGNNYTVADLEARGYDPMVYRYFCTTAHYRNKLNFTTDKTRNQSYNDPNIVFTAMESAKTSYGRLLALLREHKHGVDPAPAELADMAAEMKSAVLDDLNIPKAMGTLWSLLRLPCRSAAVYQAALDIDAVFGLRFDACDAAVQPATLDNEIAALVEQRNAARAAKDWAKADEIRDDLAARGVTLIDTKDGVTWTVD